MAVTVTKDLTDLYDAESTTGWTTDDTVTTYSGFQREGTYCLGMQGSEGTVYAYKTITSIDLTNTVIYSWLNAGSVDTKANGGFRIIVGDGTNTIAYYVGGSDDYGFQIGAWSSFVLDTSNPPANFAVLAGSEASLDFSAITQIGVQFNVPIKAVGSGDNVFFDICRYGHGLIVGGGTSGDPGTFDEIAVDDASTAAGKAYGIIRKLQTGVYGVQGRLIIGDNGTGDSYFKDTDSIVVFEDRAVPDIHYEFRVIGNGTGINSFILGNKVGSGDTAIGSNGVTITSAGPGLKIDLDTYTANVNTLNIYGSKIFKASKGILLSSVTTHEFIGNTVDQSGKVVANQCVIRNCTFSATTETPVGGIGDSALLWNNNINIKNSSFRSNTSATENPHGIQHPDAGTYTYDNLQFSGNDYDIEFSASSGDLVINTTNGSNPGTYEITNGATSVTINNAVTLTITTKNESGNPIQGVNIRIETDPGKVLISEGSTNSSGVYTYTYNYNGDQNVKVIARQKGYKNNAAYDTITTNGLSVPFTMVRDNSINLP